MAVINGTIKGVKILMDSPAGIGARKTALITADFAAYSGAGDSGSVTGVKEELQATMRNGKTVTLRQGMPAFAGVDTNKQAVYVGAVTVSGSDITFNLADNAGTELTSSTAATGVGVLVGFDES